MESPELSRPAVQVTLPKISLQLDDLAYLRSLSQPESVRCRPTQKVLDKLRFLDLIARAKTSPSKKDIEVFKKNKMGLVAKAKAAISGEQWGELESAASELRYSISEMRPKEEDVLTEKGKALLATGDVIVKVRKVGCV